ncbi:MAG: hypothetical protein ACRCZH_03440 [Cetobacterium sp.]
MKKILGILLGVICLSISTLAFDMGIFNKFENQYGYNIREKNDNSNSPNYDMYSTVARKENVDGWLVIYEVKGDDPKKEAERYFNERVKSLSTVKMYKKTVVKKNIVLFESTLDGAVKLYFVKGNFTGRYESKGNNENIKSEIETVLYNAFEI